MSTCAPASFVPHAEALARAERGLRELAAARRDRCYPAFHIASDGGWINDPNGLSYFGGRWHVFYQLHPFGPQWGTMHWGHVSSADLVTWRREPVALAPSLEVERAGVYSGSAVVGDYGRLRLFYTAHRWRNGRDEADGNQEVQCAACSTDGTRFEKLGVVVDNPDDLRDFRDPKVLRRDGRWYMVVGRRSPDGHGEVVLYASDDLDRWSWAGVLYRHPDPRVYMIECPDLFCLRAPDGDERWVLFLSAMRSQAPADGADGASKGEKGDEGAAAHDHVDTSGYLVGTWQPGEPFRPEGPACPLDRGGSLYAPQTMEAPDGRRLVVGWMRPDGALDVQDDNWCGQLSVPRELTLGDDGALRSAPARELAALRGPVRELGPLALGAEEALTLTDDARTAEVALSAPLGDSTSAALALEAHVAEDGSCARVVVSPALRRVTLVRRSADGTDAVCGVAPLPPDAGEVTLRVLVDRDSVEVFVDGGREAISAYSLPVNGPRAVCLVAESDAAEVRTLAICELRSIGLDGRA